MRTINTSPYDTRVLRRVVVAIYHVLIKTEGKRPWWPKLRVIFQTARERKAALRDHSGVVARIRLPRPTGDEWLAARGRGNGNALRTLHVAQFVRDELAAIYGRRFMSVIGENLRDLPEYVPLKITRPRPSRDVVRERYARVLELEKIWQRKLKLAQTKVKTLRARRRGYEKRAASSDSN